MRRLKLGLIAALALALAGVFSSVGPSAAQEERDDPELAAKANEYVKQKFPIDYDFFTEYNFPEKEDEKQPRRVHDLVFLPGVTRPMLVWGPWHGDSKTDGFGLDRQRYIGYDRTNESVTNPFFPPDQQAGQAPLESRNWIEEPWKDPDVQAQHYEKVIDWQLDNANLSDPGIIEAMRFGLKMTAGLNGYEVTSETERSPLYQNPQRYVHVYLPPGPETWGMGVIFHRKDDGSVWYISVPLKPESLHNFPDLAARLDPPEREAKPGDEVSFTLTASLDGLWNERIGGRVYLAHVVGDNMYPVSFSLNGQESQVDEELGAAYVDVFPGKDGDLQTQIAVHAQEVGSTVQAGIVPVLDLGALGILPIPWFDADLSNNWTEAAIVVNQPNLLVRNLSLDPNPCFPGDAVAASAEIVNEGFQDVTTIARWIFNDQVIAEEEVWIPAGGYNVTQAQIQAPDEPGTYAVGVLANPNHDRPANEKTYDDNYAEGYLTVEEPCTDVSVQLGLSDAGVPSGGTVTAYATVRRADDGPSGPVTVSVIVTGPGASKTWTVSLDRGEETTKQASFQVFGSGSAVFSAEAWPQGIEDCAPGNNRDSESIAVEQPPNAPQPDKGIFVRLIS